MPVKDIFDIPFDEGTLTKLEIFEKYFDKWLPTFVMSGYKYPIQVFDLFSGSGSDNNGIPGSPLRILAIIKRHSTILEKKKIVVHLFFNDIDCKKVTLLEKIVSQKITDDGLSAYVNTTFTNLAFSEFLTKNNSILRDGCNLIFIDQNGFKEVNEPVFKYLIALERTEFMFFISSSHIRRFADEPEFKTHHPKFDAEKIKSAPRKLVHNVICEEFQKYVPSEVRSFGLIPFSLMKEDHNNIHGLIFVSKHVLGADKFLTVVWNQNIINGNANYDIDEEASKKQGDLFESRKLTKIESFQNRLRNKVLIKEVKSNREAYFFALNEGHICKHAVEELKKMRKEGLITFESSSPLVNYEQVIRANRILEFRILNNEIVKN
jgi:three-Cys-motif partner protein